MQSANKRSRITNQSLKIVPMEIQADNLISQIVNLDAEKAVLGAVLRDPSCYASVSEILQPGDFWQLTHGFVWYAFEQITSRGAAIDVVSVADELNALKRLPDNGAYWLATIAESAPNSHSAETYAQIVRESATRLRICMAAERMKAMAADRIEFRDPDKLVDACNLSLFEATDQQTKSAKTGLSDIVSSYFESVEKAINEGTTRGVPTGFSNLDKLLKGGMPGELTVIAGAEGMGKTTLALCLARNIALSGRNVAIFSLEMSQEEIARILISMQTGIAKRALKAYDLTREQWSEFVDAYGKISSLSIDVIDEFPSLKPIQLRRRLRTMMTAQKIPVEAVIVDGLWLMQDDEDTPERPRAVFNITRDLIQIARAFNVPIWITHQYNGDAQNRQDKRPLLRDLAESSGVRRNSQVILGLYRDSYYGIESMREFTELHVLKDRNGSGAQGKYIKFDYDHKRNRFLPIGEGE